MKRAILAAGAVVAAGLQADSVGYELPTPTIILIAPDPVGRVGTEKGSRLHFDSSCGTQLFFGALDVAKRGQAAIPDVVATIAAAPEQERGGVLMTLHFLGRDADAAAPLLLPLLDDPGPAVRTLAADALGTIFEPPQRDDPCRRTRR